MLLHKEMAVAATDRSTVLTVRIPAALDRRIARIARQRRSTKSAVLRGVLQRALADGPEPDDPVTEARRQSLLVSSRPSENDALDFITHAGDAGGWR